MADRPDLFRRLRDLPVVGRAADWGLGPSAVSEDTKRAGSRIAGLKATESACPYCAVGCGQIVYTRDGELVDIEGNPRSPINQGRLCPKGAASRQLIQQPGRLSKVKYAGGHRVGGARARDGDGLCRGLDPAQLGRPDDPRRHDRAAAAGQHRTPGRRDHSCVLNLSATGRLGRVGRDGTDLHRYGVGWGPSGRWFKSSRPD